MVLITMAESQSVVGLLLSGITMFTSVKTRVVADLYRYLFFCYACLFWGFCGDKFFSGAQSGQPFEIF